VKQRARWGKLTAEADRPAESDILIVALALTRDFCAVSVIAKVGKSFSPRLWRGWGLILYLVARPTLAASAGLRARSGAIPKYRKLIRYTIDLLPLIKTLS
jgi:hypothetical protein